MEATNVASWGSVQEVLTKDNFQRWKTLMKNYLLAKNLWAVVENDSTKFTSPRSRRMNAEALLIIQLSCGSKIFDDIRHFETAKEAWNHLCSHYGSELKAKLDIEHGVVDDDLLQYKDVYWYVEKGDWTNAESFIRDDGALFSTSASGRTLLHLATIAGHVDIVEGLVKEGSDKLVKMQDNRGHTALSLAARLTGNTDVATCMVEKKGGGVREDLLGIVNEDGEIPLLLAAANGHTEMTRYLYKKTPKEALRGQDSRSGVLMLERCIKAEIFDVALRLLESDPKLPTESLSDGFRALHELAQMPSAFLSGSQFGLRQQIIYNSRFGRPVLNFLLLPVKFLGRLLLQIVYVFVQFFKFLNMFGIREIYEQKCTHYEVQQILRCLQRSVAEFNDSQIDQASVYDAMLHAAKHGVVEFIIAMRKANPNLLWAMDSRMRGIFSYAVLKRKQKVFQLIHTLNGRKDMIKSRKDVFGNNLLHLAGHLGSSSVLNHRPGAALQMQREIQWFKAVEKIVHPKCKEEKNDDNKKPHELFTETHKELVKAGEKWAKETARSFTLVGTLITTIMFAAAFTIPGGNHQDTGVPIFLNSTVFTAFLIADAISLFTSATSVLTFIAILTSRFAEQDFLKSLPCKLLLGLFFLFFSVVSMIVAFCAALAMVLKTYRAYKRLIIGATIFGSIPVMVLVLSQLRLIYEIFQSTRSNPISYVERKNQ
ncbi:Ankyrin repeat domain-containing protein 50 [Spatholobus suberectus]|nr:Ankyrin repeat domain-containing protein 50 [Spatholobus suberectus]